MECGIHAERCFVHCRIGSLEIYFLILAPAPPVHCRIGSLEIFMGNHYSRISVHCRIGSYKNPIYIGDCVVNQLQLLNILNITLTMVILHFIGIIVALP